MDKNQKLIIEAVKKHEALMIKDLKLLFEQQLGITHAINWRTILIKSRKFIKELEVGEAVIHRPAYGILDNSEAEQFILDMRKEGYTLRQIADTFNLTQERIRQMEAKALVRERKRAK